MAKKKITDLQLRGSVTDDLNLPSDDGIQTYRVTAQMIRNYIINPLLDLFVKTGTIHDWGGLPANIPSGYLYCNGQAVSRTDYAALFAAIGTAHGAGNGTTTFNLPDRRGRFVRGMADGQAMDPDRATRTAAQAGGNTGDNVGSVQGHAFQTHTHIQNPHDHNIPTGNTSGSNFASSFIARTINDTTSYSVTNSTAVNQNAAASGTTAQASTAETRPVNVNAVFMIKI